MQATYPTLLAAKALLFLIGMIAAGPTAVQAGEKPESESPVVQMQAVWIDVRSWIEYQADHIEGDIRIAHEDIVAGVADQYPDKDTPIRLYCAAGGRAATAQQSLQAAGYRNVVNAGGISDVRALRELRGVDTSGSN